MAHEISFVKHKTGDMAYVGDRPWWGVGQKLEPGASLEEWIVASGFDFEVLPAPLYYDVQPDGFESDFRRDDSNVVLYRSDTKHALGIVSKRYKIVQPRDIAEFFRSLIEIHGFQMETMGVLRGGKVYWALAKVPYGFKLTSDDQVEGYLLLSTSADGTMTTRGTFSSIRVVCMNTLKIAYGRSADVVSVPHIRYFNPDKVKVDLGLLDSRWSEFREIAEDLASKSVTLTDVKDYFANVLELDEIPDESNKNFDDLMVLYKNGVGQNTRAAKDTAWGALNAVTLWVDHDRRSKGGVYGRLYSAWFGSGSQIKERAFKLAREMLL